MLIDLERKLCASNDLLRLGILLDLLISVVRLENTFESIVDSTGKQAPIQLSRLQKSIASTTSRRFQEESTKPLAPFLAETMRILRVTIERSESAGQGEDWLQTACTDRLQDCLYFLSDFVNVTHSTNFDEATFQVYLGLGQSLLTTLDSNLGLEELGDTMRRRLGGFAPFWQLRNGQSMELIWSRIKPFVPTTLEQLQQAIRVENLAERYDALIWTSGAPLGKLEQTRQLIAQLWTSTEVDADCMVNSIQVGLVHCSRTIIAYSGRISRMHSIIWRHDMTLLRMRESHTYSRSSRPCVNTELGRMGLSPPESMTCLGCSPVSLQESFSKAWRVAQAGICSVR